MNALVISVTLSCPRQFSTLVRIFPHSFGALAIANYFSS